MFGKLGARGQQTAVAAGAAALAALAPRAACAHPGQDPPAGPWWAAWNFDPVVLLNLALLVWLFQRGFARLNARGSSRAISRRHALAFGGAVLALLAALVSPLDRFSEQLSWVHMVQHMVLMMIAAPLLVLSAPATVLLWGVPGRWRPRVARWRGWLERPFARGNPFWHPLAIWLLYAATLWIWHVPALYQAALRDWFVHDLQHLTFFVAACLFWRVVLDPLSRLRLNPGLGVLYVFTTSLHASALGVFMTLSPLVWYSDYLDRTGAWGLTPLEDQQLAGLIMWMPACLIYAIAAVGIFMAWLAELPAARAPRRSGLRAAVDATRAGGAANGSPMTAAARTSLVRRRIL